jgi:hypothetical protein
MFYKHIFQYIITQGGGRPKHSIKCEFFWICPVRVGEEINFNFVVRWQKGSALARKEICVKTADTPANISISWWF